MACGTDLLHLCQDGIVVAVNGKLFDILDMSGGRTFLPQFVAAPAPVGHLSGLHRLFKSFTVHISDHQHFQIFVVLHNNRDHAVGVQFQLIPAHLALERIDLNAMLFRFQLGCHQIFIQIRECISADTADIVEHQKLQQAVTVCTCGNRKYRHFYKAGSCTHIHFIAEQDHTGGIFIYPRLVCLQLCKTVCTDRDFFFSETFGYFFCQVDIGCFGII